MRPCKHALCVQNVGTEYFLLLEILDRTLTIQKKNLFKMRGAAQYVTLWCFIGIVAELWTVDILSVGCPSHTWRKVYKSWVMSRIGIMHAAYHQEF